MQLQDSLQHLIVEKSSIFPVEQLKKLDFNKIPTHVAFIPDGNRRWAKKNHISIMQGHRKGSDNLMEIAKAAKVLGIKVITFYIFSTENWNRDTFEIRTLMWLLESYLIEQRPTMLDLGVRFQTIGDTTRFSQRIQRTIRETKEITSHCKDIEMVLALNYGSRNEICRAVQSILSEYSKNPSLAKEGIPENLISQHLDTAKWPDPDLLIRTSGEVRLSNFLLWQSSYSEIFIVDVLWPDFHPHHLLNTIIEFQMRERRLGGG